MLSYQIRTFSEAIRYARRAASCTWFQGLFKYCILRGKDGLLASQISHKDRSFFICKISFVFLVLITAKKYMKSPSK